jgi:protein-S-isoprenylcysteine O-methyltransferase Ste14
MTRAVWSKLFVTFIVIAALLFAGAGTLAWPAGWVFLGIFFVASTAMTIGLARHDPALLAERMRFPIQAGQPGWDKIFIGLVLPLVSVWFVFMGLDAVRFRWSMMPVALQALGLLLLIVALGASYLVFRANTFLAAVVRVQSERHHAVVSTGPFGIVRHPLYAAAMLWFVAAPLALGSWWGLAYALLPAAGLIVRTVLEDRMLAGSLPGYTAYQAKVRYRLIPGVW